ncbi:hypothetical protein HanXRQr2_Chr17g0821511 [Helianthus annuus]|uniref:Uncharacterized protein n=1 Tax=Helianthus annuus TaxID=4232 RepID=A0A9K3GV74_HELAN|nr:hypothetical protein HanXRQr2_Chr17g0821511 [Helianthus annuus]KAJ0435299.1 hypothetical protein HanIR_Chr17g0891811 [Helianthus annuus]KAJ0448857.1 hypothetical protein HanHA89_Chr17g0721841 [Helianthus annuus]KAJ0633736.1 hypothetical protein HanLR1_Chr17g0680271 [Helianthus annuus]KAJ0814724.1 hypothetical protein HanPSC8_Chr17g0789161 [Helianthus annuus]
MILKHNCLPPGSLWVSKPVEEFNLATIKRNWKIQVQLCGSKYSVTEELGHKYEFIDLNEHQGVAEDVEMVDKEDEVEPAGPWGPKQSYIRPHRELNEDVARFVNRRRVPSYRNFNRSQQEVFDNISAVMGEGREYEARRKKWEQAHQAQLQAQWDAESAHQERVENIWRSNSCSKLYKDHKLSRWYNSSSKRWPEDEHGRNTRRGSESSRTQWKAADGVLCTYPMNWLLIMPRSSMIRNDTGEIGKPASPTQNIRGVLTIPTSLFLEAPLIHHLIGPRQRGLVSSRPSFSSQQKESRVPLITNKRCLRLLPDTRTIRTYQSNRMSNISGDGEVCVLLLLYIFLVYFNFFSISFFLVK